MVAKQTVKSIVKDNLKPLENKVRDLEQTLIDTVVSIVEQPSPKNGKDGKAVHGKDGLSGKDGKRGLQGQIGFSGIDGKRGLDGLNGKDGQDGKDGDKGDSGEKGDKGDKGKDGVTHHTFSNEGGGGASPLRAGEIGRLDPVSPVLGTDALLILRAGTLYRPSLTTISQAVFDNTDFTENSVLFVGADGVISEDNTNFTWDDTNDVLATRKTTVNGQTTINLPADENVIVDGSTNQRTVTTGAYRQTHTPAIPGTRAFNIVIDANSQADTNSIVSEFTATGMKDGERGSGYQFDVYTSNSTGGELNAVQVEKVGTGLAEVHGLHTGVGVKPLHQEAGIFGAIEKAFTYDDSGASFADVTAAFSSSGTNVQLFVENDDIVYIGDDATFGSLEVILAVMASNPGVKPIFEYWDGSIWMDFGPSDGTNGFRLNGVIGWEATDLTGWATTSVNGSTKYWIRIIRAANNLSIVPTESTIQISAPTLYEWDDDGSLIINEITIAGRVEMQDYAQSFLLMGG